MDAILHSFLVIWNLQAPAGARLTISGEVTGKDGRRKQGEI